MHARAAGDVRRIGFVFAGDWAPRAVHGPAVLPAAAAGSLVSRERAKGGEGRHVGSDAAIVAGADALLAAVRWLLALAPS